MDQIEIETGYSKQAVIKLLAKLGEHFGIDKKTGTFGQDRTAFSRWKMPVTLERGFGKPAECGNPPAPELVVIKFTDTTWGINIEVIGENINFDGYWDFNTKRWVWAVDRKVPPTQFYDFDFISIMHHALVRCIEDGDWGNDKPVGITDKMFLMSCNLTEAEFNREARLAHSAYDFIDNGLKIRPLDDQDGDRQFDVEHQ